MTSQALTRQAQALSKQKWDNCLGLIAKEFKLLEARVIESPQKHQDKLTKILQEYLSVIEAK